jgi:hypothetical protein
MSDASLGNDGSVNGLDLTIDYHYRVAHTESSAFEWWKVDFG